LNVVGKSFIWVRLFPTNKTETLAAAAIFAASIKKIGKLILQMRDTSADFSHNPCPFLLPSF
jgi:hypothetical protein